MPYILDADWIINALAGREPAVSTIKRLAPAQIAVSIITVGEVLEGAFGSANPEARLALYHEFLHPFHLIGVNEAIIEKFAEIRAYLRRTRQIISDFDILLGATALHHDLTVLTFNRRHLARIDGLRVYQAP